MLGAKPPRVVLAISDRSAFPALRHHANAPRPTLFIISSEYGPCALYRSLYLIYIFNLYAIRIGGQSPLDLAVRFEIAMP